MALTLRLLGGLTTEEIARAFLVSNQRSPSASSGPNERWPRSACRSRFRAAPIGPLVSHQFSRSCTSFSTRATLLLPVTTGSGPRSAKMHFVWGASLAELTPDDSEVHGLVALMEIQASRFRARTGSNRGADSALRSEPCSVGPASDPPRSSRARACEQTWRSARSLRNPGQHRRLSRPGKDP